MNAQTFFTHARLPAALPPHRSRWPAVAAALASAVATCAHPADAKIVEYIWHAFSRACYNGPIETITYNPAGAERLLYTESNQYVLAGGLYVSVGLHVDAWRNTWRSYAGTCCWQTPSYVEGRHFAEYPVGHRYQMHDSSATDCNLGEWVVAQAQSEQPAEAGDRELPWMRGLELNYGPPPADAPDWVRNYPGWVWSVGQYRPPPAGATSMARPQVRSIVPYPGMKLGEGPHGGLRVGRVTVVSIDELPPALRDAERARATARGRGAIETVGERDGYWPEPLIGLVAAPGVGSRGRMSFTPVDVRRIEGADLTYLGAGDVGDAMPGEEILTAARYFQRADGVKVALGEDDFSQGGALIIVREAQNARVGSHLAELVVQRAQSGRVRTLLSWADAHTHYTLSVDDDVDHPHGWARFDRAWLLGVAAALGT